MVMNRCGDTNVFSHLSHFKEKKMNYDRKFKHQQQRVQDLVRQVEDLESENEMLNKEVENLHQINDIRNQELADIRKTCAIAEDKYACSVEELKALQKDYKALIGLMADSKQRYEKEVKNLIKQIKKNT